MKTTTDHAREVRAAFKRRGWNSRMIGVRVEYFSLGSAINVTIKSPEVNALEAKRIAEDAEHIRRCEYSGEILGGGNRYVSVRWADSVREEIARTRFDALRDALARIPEDARGRIEPIAGTLCGVSRPNSATAHIWVLGGVGSFACQFYPGSDAGILDGAFCVALIERGDFSGDLR